VEIGGKHNFSSPPALAAKIHCNNHYSKIFLKLENYKACCCDERCESVETSETPIAHAAYGARLRVAVCENRGKQSPYLRVSREIQNLVHSHQQNFRTLLKPSPQDMGMSSRANFEKIRNHGAQLSQKESVQQRQQEKRPAFLNKERGKS